MASLVTSQVIHGREDLSNIINKITPEETPVYSMLAKTKASGIRHESLTEALNAPNADNAYAESATFEDTSLTTPKRLGNYTQISQKVVNVSGTLQAIDTAGTKDEFARQIRKAGVEIRRDIEAAIVSPNASVAGPVRKSAGMEAWISTNVAHGAGGSTPGFNGTVTPVPVDGTVRAITEPMFNEVIQGAYQNGANLKKVIAGPALKAAISKFSGNATKYVETKDKTVTAGVDVYVSDFGRHEIMPHRIMRSRTVILFDPDLWALATLRNFKTEDLGKLADSDRKSITVEWTLESKNELGNAKIADVKP